MDKKELRKICLKIRQLCSAQEINHISNLIVTNIKNSEIYKKSQNVAIYYPIKNEPDITSLLNDKDKKFYFPKCTDNNLYFAEFLGIYNIGAYSIYEPTGNVVDPSVLDVVYIPALCCNLNFYRLGYGKGYYDRFFSRNTISAKKIIVCSKRFIRDDFVQEPFDIKCDAIVNEMMYYT